MARVDFIDSAQDTISVDEVRQIMQNCGRGLSAHDMKQFIDWIVQEYSDIYHHIDDIIITGGGMVEPTGSSLYGRKYDSVSDSYIWYDISDRAPELTATDGDVYGRYGDGSGYLWTSVDDLVDDKIASSMPTIPSYSDIWTNINSNINAEFIYGKFASKIIGTAPITVTLTGSPNYNVDIGIDTSDLADLFDSGDVTYNSVSDKIEINFPSVPTVGTLNTTSTSTLTTQSSESFGGTINLHKVSKTGTYADLIGLPTIPAAAYDGKLKGISSTSTQTAPTNATEIFSANSSSGNTITLHKVAWTGTYADLIGLPSLYSSYGTNTDGAVTQKYFTERLFYQGNSASGLDFRVFTDWAVGVNSITQSSDNNLHVPTDKQSVVATVSAGTYTLEIPSGTTYTKYNTLASTPCNLYGSATGAIINMRIAATGAVTLNFPASSATLHYQSFNPATDAPITLASGESIELSIGSIGNSGGTIEVVVRVIN